MKLLSSWLSKLSLMNKEKAVFMTFGNYVDSVPQKVIIRINGTENLELSLVNTWE